MRPSSSPFRAAVVSLVAALIPLCAACNPGNDPLTTNSVAHVATSVVVMDGAAQSALVGTNLDRPIGVRVLDENGNAFPGANVTWITEDNNGFAASATSSSDSNGDATMVWMMGTRAKVDTMTARIANNATVRITATAIGGMAAQFAAVSGNDQSVTAGGVSVPLVVKLTDAQGNPIGGSTVTWTTTSGTLSKISTITDPVTGLSSVTLTTSLTPGSATVTAQVSATMSVSFTIIGT